MQTQSEVAQLRRHIEEECQALQNLSLFTVTAPHALIAARYRSLERHHTQLRTLIGEEQATSMIVDVYNQYVH